MNSPGDESPAGLAKSLLEVVGRTPISREPPSRSPRERARTIRTTAALEAAAISGTLALPPGPAGLATILPDLVAVWRIQAQMVADIAGAFGHTARLSREQMFYCMFRHAAAQAVRDLVSHVGKRLIFRRATLQVLQVAAHKVGLRVTGRVVAQTVARWVPVAGAAGVAGFAYYDTIRVGDTAIEVFAPPHGILCESSVVEEEGVEEEGVEEEGVEGEGVEGEGVEAGRAAASDTAGGSCLGGGDAARCVEPGAE